MTAAAIAFVLPVTVGLITGNMDLRDLVFTVLLTVAVFTLVFVASSVSERRQHHQR